MFKLRNYQQDAVNNALQYFRKKRDPALIVLPTGAGKSLVIAELAKLARGRVLVLAHVKELVEQNHGKYESYDLTAGIYSAGLNKRDTEHKVIFGSIQSVANAGEDFFSDFNLVVIDECHRVSLDNDSQYSTVIKKLKLNNPQICVLGLTATPYRLGLGWIYNFASDGETKTEEERFFKRCVFELPLDYMIRNKFLTVPIKVDIPVTCYDFSELTQKGRMYSNSDIEEILKGQRQLTPLIIKNVIDITEKYHRQGVMIFSSTVAHAKDILSYLPEGEAEIILGDTDTGERDDLIAQFKEKKFKYLVNVSVLTTGFDAPHVDVIAILRTTESVSLYQQIIGRGLRLAEGKTDCFILDYTGMGFDIYSPEVSDKKPNENSVPVEIECPKCGFENNFWGRVDNEGNIEEHYGRKCRGGIQNSDTFEIIPCGFLFRSKLCNKCGFENDITARQCKSCGVILVDPEAKLKQARLSKDAHIMKPDSVEMIQRADKRGNEFLEIKYYDYDAQSLSEFFYLNNSTSIKKFEINFLRSHLKRPEYKITVSSISDVLENQWMFRVPSFIIARKQERFWKITEKIFAEEL